MSERVDHDRLADFVGGALDGTPDADAVRRLITSSPAWAGAYSDLLAADAAVTADLAAYTSRPTPMPADVAHRLDALLNSLAATAPPQPDAPAGPGSAARGESDAGCSAVSGAAPAGSAGGDVGRAGSARAGSAPGGSGRAGSGPGGSEPAGSGPAGSGPGRAGSSTAGRHSRSGPGRRSVPRARRLYAALSAVAAVIAVGLGLTQLIRPMQATQQDSPAAGADAGAAGIPPQVAAAPAQVTSGRDYRPGDFAGLAAAASDLAVHGASEGARAGAAGSDAPGSDAGGTDRQEAAPGFAGRTADEGAPLAVPAPAPGELTRLMAAAARQACLDAVRAVHGGTPVLLDYARFDRRPAVVMLLNGSRTGAGRQWIVVVGPDCGLSGGITDERYNGPAT